MISSYPDPDHIDAYAQSAGLNREDVIRDIARLATIASLCEKGWLNRDCVLCGGMALRLRGSNRFTVFDTDTSMRGRLDEVELTGALSVDEDALEIEPADPNHWDRRRKLTIAQPIDYRAYFASVDPAEPVKDRFSFTVSQRGLEEECEWLPLQSPYPALVFEREYEVPVMCIEEQAAEKIVGWAAASLMKHYLDLAWIAKKHRSQLNAETMVRLVEAKLRVGRETFPAAYKDLQKVMDLRDPLSRAPHDYHGPLNSNRDHKTKSIRFQGNGMDVYEARHLIQTRVLPLLFPEELFASPAPQSSR